MEAKYRNKDKECCQITWIFNLGAALNSTMPSDPEMKLYPEIKLCCYFLVYRGWSTTAFRKLAQNKKILFDSLD